MSHAHSPWYHSAAIVALPDGREFFVDSCAASVPDHDIGNALCAFAFFMGLESGYRVTPALVEASEGHEDWNGDEEYGHYEETE